MRKIIAFSLVAAALTVSACNTIAGVGRDVSVISAGFKLDGRAPRVAAPPPTLGQHADSLLAELGLGADEITALRAARVLGGEGKGPNDDGRP